MNSHNRGLRDLAFVAVLMAVPIASYFFVFAPRNDEIAKARAEISAKNPNWKKVYDDYSDFRKEQNLWFRFTEARFDGFMQAQKL